MQVRKWDQSYGQKHPKEKPTVGRTTGLCGYFLHYPCQLQMLLTALLSLHFCAALGIIICIESDNKNFPYLQTSNCPCSAASWRGDPPRLSVDEMSPLAFSHFKTLTCPVE